ncbi:unnamed protein product [Peniophora sp. CBMAI 1063]|nr:unnamed protein product [Peniophora sp. CBMAI 1063]
MEVWGKRFLLSEKLQRCGIRTEKPIRGHALRTVIVARQLRWTGIERARLRLDFILYHHHLMSPLSRTHSSHGRLSPKASCTGPLSSRRSAKRTYSYSACSPSYDNRTTIPGPACDPDPWRLAKRARLVRTSSFVEAATAPRFNAAKLSRNTASIKTTLATTSTAFGLPSPPIRRLCRSRLAAAPSPSTRLIERPRPNLDGIVHLSSQAFTELRKSVAQVNEDFVHRMRAWEAERTQTLSSTASNMTGGESPMQLDDAETSGEMGDDEDIEIISNEGPSHERSAYASHCPPQIWASLPARTSAMADKDAAMSPVPAAISTRSTRRNSFSVIYNPPSSMSKPRREERVDRALDALSLAMSTGAGGIRDYSAVWDVLGVDPSCGVGDIGGMWD